MLSGPFHLLRSSRRGIAAIEFALIAPLFGTMIIGVFDTAKAVILWEQVQNTAHLVATSAATVSTINPDKSTTLSAAAAQQSMSIIYAEMPWVRSLIEQGQRSVTLTSVEFKPLSNGCTPTAGQNCYAANVAWSAAYAGGQAGNAAQFVQGSTALRACGSLTQLTPKASIPVGMTPLTVLRTANVSQPDAIIVADVHYQYSPMFFRFVTGKIDFWSTYHHSVRIGTTTVSPGLQYTLYGGSSASNATGNCPGLP